MTALWKDGHLQRLELQALSVEDTAALLEAALDGPVLSTTAHRLWSITRGNLLYLRQLFDGERETGRLQQVEGVWRWSGSPHLSPSLVELVQERIGALSEAERSVVELLAFGEPLGVALLAQLVDADVVERVEARGLIEVAVDGRRLDARLAHPLYGEVQRARCGQLRARRLRGRIASALAATGARRVDDALRRAVLAIDSDEMPDHGLLIAAAHRAAALSDAPLAARLARAAAAAGGGFEARLTLATVLVGNGDEAADELQDLAAAARTDGERAEAALLQVISLAFLSSRPTEAAAALDIAERSVVDPQAIAVLSAMRAGLDATEGRPGRAVEAATAALATPGLPDHAAAYASWALTLAYGMTGRTDELGPVVGAGIAAAVRSADTAWLAIALIGWQVFGVALGGYIDRADTIAGEARERYGDMPFPAAVSDVLLGFAATARGRVRTALRRLREARAALAPFGTAGGWTAACLLRLPQVLATCGDPEGAREALAALEQHRHTGMAILDPAIEMSRSWVLAAEGATSLAVDTASSAAAMAAATGEYAFEVEALHMAVVFGDRTVAARLSELASTVDGPRAAMAAAHAAALAADDAVGLVAVSERLEVMGALLLAADAAAQAAEIHVRHGRRGSANVAAQRARRLATTCEDAVTPALRALAQPLPLTDREREIATMAASGLSNKEIADQLTLSVRTVEGHLYRMFQRLGVSDRATLAEILRP